MKHPSQSKTIWVNLIPLIISLNEIGISLFNNAKITYSMMAVAALSILNIILRFFTSESIKKVPVIIAALLLTSCSSVQQKLEPELFYKRDVEIIINGVSYEGVTTAPYAKSYNITLSPKGDADLMLLRTCHREYSVEKGNSGWFGLGKKNRFTYQYTPIPGIEDSRACPLQVDVYESDKGRHSWALIAFENPKYQIPFKVNCNGETYSANGVSACQARNQTFQRLIVEQPIRFAPASGACAQPTRVNESVFEFKTSIGECVYTFDSPDGKIGRLYIVGWEGVLVRNTQ